LLITSFTAVKEELLVGKWKGEDKGGIGFLSLSADGFATFEMNGQTMGGKSFDMSGVIATMRYSTDATTAPASIDFIIYEEATYKEISRLKGIYKMNTPDKLQIALMFEEGRGRPDDFSTDNIMFYRVE
jgi:uncharacterized protein (TIGR03067 family)